MILTDGSESPPRRCAGSPRPLKVKAAKMSGHIDNFSDEIQTWNRAALHRLRGEFVGVDTSSGHFGFLESLCARGTNAPTMNLLFEIGESGIGPCGGRVVFQPAVSEPDRKGLPQF